MKIDLIRPYPKNARVHSKKQIDLIAKSIQEFGFRQPIVLDKNNEVIIGHARLEAAKQLGLKEVPTIDASDLTPQKVKALRLADNKLAELAQWDMDLAIEELKGLDDDLIDLTGFDRDLLIDIKEDDFDAQAEYDKILEPTTKLGDLWQLGEHRLLCGDSTQKASYEVVLGQKRASLVFTDPPYNVGYDYWGFRGTRKMGVKSKKVFNDKKKPEEYQKFIRQVFQNLFDFSKDSSSVYCWHGTSGEREVKNALIDS